MQLLAEVELEILDKYHLDVIPVEGTGSAWYRMQPHQGLRKNLFCGQEVYFPPDTHIAEEPDGSWVLQDANGKAYARMPNDGYYFDFIRTTMAGRKIDPKSFQPNNTVTDEELQTLSDNSEFLYNNTDKALLGWGASISMLGLSALLSDNITQGSLDEWLILLMTEKETAHDMMGRFTDAVIERTRLYHQALADRCLIWGIASDDAGTQKNGLICPDLFREMIKPYYKRLCDWVHKNTTWKTFLHSCGAIHDYIADWIEAGVDILNPVQISAANMEPHKLMKDFGGKVVFWGGGCDTQHVLHQAPPEQVRNHVRDNLECFKKGTGGYVFTQVHNIQQNVPAENVDAMLKAAYEFGAY
jgi:uroporphyrinogen decarboxylase